MSSTNIIKLTQEVETQEPFLPLEQAIALYLEWLHNQYNWLLDRDAGNRKIALALLKKECAEKLNDRPRNLWNKIIQALFPE